MFKLNLTYPAVFLFILFITIIVVIILQLSHLAKKYKYLNFKSVIVTDQVIYYMSDKIKGITYIYNISTMSIYITIKDVNDKIIYIDKPDQKDIFKDSYLTSVFDKNKIEIINNEYNDFVKILYFKFNIRYEE